MHNAFRSSVLPVATAAVFVSMLGCAAIDAPAPSAEALRPGLYRVSAGDGSTLLRTSPDGVVVVDPPRAGGHDRLMAEITRVAGTSSPRVRALILTGAGDRQAGRVSAFAEAGVPVVVQKRAVAAWPTSPARVVAFDADHRLHAGGVVVEVEHVGRGRSGADSVVLFPDLRVAAVGELFTHDEPKPDCASGGSYAGWAAAITHLLYSDFELAVPSRGAPVGKPELRAFKAKLEAMAAERGGVSARLACGE
jgi:hypothetical protein